MHFIHNRLNMRQLSVNHLLVKPISPGQETRNRYSVTDWERAFQNDHIIRADAQ